MLTLDPTIRHAILQPEWLRGVEVVYLEGDDAELQWNLAVRLQAAQQENPT